MIPITKQQLDAVQTLADFHAWRKQEAQRVHPYHHIVVAGTAGGKTLCGAPVRITDRKASLRALEGIADEPPPAGFYCGGCINECIRRYGQ